MRPCPRTRLLLAAAFTALAAAAIFGYVAASAPAGNRTPFTFDFTANPGPSAITFGKNVAYQGQFSNTGKSNWVHVVFSQTVPYAQLTDGSKLYARLVYSSCEANPSAPPDTTGMTVYSCPEIQSLPSGSGLKKVTLVWQSAALPQGTSCSSPCQLTSTAKFAFKEANSGTNDTFQKGPVVTSLFDVPDKQNAGGYPIRACTDVSSSPTLVTNLTVGADNPVATKVCEPTLPANDPLDPGLATTITERPSNSDETNGRTQVSDICIADVGQTCPGPAFDFGANGGTLATFVFIYDKATYGKITQMFHDNVLVSSSTTADPNCQISFDGPNQVYIATCHSSTNGSWKGG